jgi:hypothetical protein
MSRPINKKLCLITPDRNDRPEFLEHCKWQMERQTVRAGHHYIINDKPRSQSEVDIVPRIKLGMAMALRDGFESCLIIENDDYYPDDYVARMSEYLHQSLMVGIDQTVYYNIQQPSFRRLFHAGRSSLFCTGVNMKAIEDYQWPENGLLYFDIHLWKHTCWKVFQAFTYGPVGIKHGTGFCPGNFHNGIVNGKPAKGMIDDRDYHWLKSQVRAESFEFYTNLKS